MIPDSISARGGYGSFPCGGNGTCGKCKIEILSGSLPITPADRRLLSEQELAAGIRLACQADIPADVTVRPLWNSEEDIVAVGGDSIKGVDDSNGIEAVSDSNGISGAASLEYGIAVDLGTTTIAVSLVDMTDKAVVDTVTSINHQRRFGADVISRINAACSGRADELRSLVVEDINSCITQLAELHGLDISSVKKIAVAGNTTMEHLLLGYSCETLGRAPFTAVSLDTAKLPACEVLGNLYCKDTVLFVLPGVSVYVGADILAGICECGMDRSEEVLMLVDLGTNGEMAIGNQNGILVTSTAAGPAFEGGNISCGTGSIPGAVKSVDIDMNTGRVKLGIIGDKTPVGLCGTGVVETVCELLKARIIDGTGLLEDEYFEDGYELAEDIFFTQKDIRQFQLAKGAVRAGIEVLISEYSRDVASEGQASEGQVSERQASEGQALRIDRLYLAGGFGTFLNAEKAAGTGIIPKELVSSVVAAGNTSLRGATAFLTDAGYADRLEGIKAKCRAVELAQNDGFNNLFLEKMNFED